MINNVFNNQNQFPNFNFGNNKNNNVMNNYNMNNMNNFNNMNNLNNMNNINNMNSMNNFNNINNMNNFNNMINMNSMNLINNNINNNFGGFNNFNMNNFNNNFNNNYNKMNMLMNNINLNRNNNLNFNMNNNMNVNLKSKPITVYILFYKKSNEFELPIEIQILSEEKVCDLIEKWRAKVGDNDSSLEFMLNDKYLDQSLTLAEAGIDINDTIYVVRTKGIKGGGAWLMKEINIKFIKLSQNFLNNNENSEIIGLLKLCLLKEVSQKISYDNLKKLPKLIYCIIKILSNGYIEDDPNDLKKNIVDVLKKIKGSSIINFSNYVDEIIDSYQINEILNLLSKEDLKEMNDIKNRLSKYNNSIKLFNNEFEKSKKESIFEFSVISLVIIEREDFETFERERKKCPNRVERILYHGTSIEPISNILTGLYRKSMERNKAINGKGVYFTDLLDYGWYYGGEAGNRANFYSIPKIDDTFTVIVNSIYYNRNGFKQVTDNKRTPGKNEINFAYAGAGSERLKIPDTSKFLANEYVIYELDQICPFMSAKLKRVEYCVIWRDTNFSINPVYNNEFDQKFKAFLKERMKYISQNAKYNIYPCETTEEALKLVNRKKYNKIILISNVGTDKGGKNFVEKARQIIGNDVITLFLAYKISHLDWIKNFKNAIFSNEPKFYEEYIQCFEENNIKIQLKNLIKKMEEHYGVKFNFDDSFLDYPNFKEEGVYSEMRF